jgi:ribosome-associated heat shock protein Hsp15
VEPRDKDVAGAPPEPVRVDKWLWAARFYKTRGLAAEAIAGGRVQVNGARAKHAKTVKPGDQIRLRLGPYEHLLTVRALSVRRGPAPQAALLYEEDPGGKARRLHLAEQLRLAAIAFTYGEGKPTKKDRREILRFKRGE